MARKPTASLPDVFARPGNAPARGTPIEALPRDDEPNTEVPPPTPVAVTVAAPDRSGMSAAPALVVDGGSEPAASGDAPVRSTTLLPASAEQTVRREAATRQSDPDTRSGDARSGHAQSGTVQSAGAVTGTSPLSGSHDDGPARVHAPHRAIPPTAEPPRSAMLDAGAPGQETDTGMRSARVIALAALAVSLTTPFWFDSALRVLGVTPALHQAQREDTMAIGRQERKLRDVEQRLGAVDAQLVRTRSDMARVERVRADTAAWTRVIVLTRLTDALRRGTPFHAELVTARALEGPESDLGPLIAAVGSYAPIGVPTDATLAADFRRVTDPVLRPARGLNPIAWVAAVAAWLPFGRGSADPDPAHAVLRDAAALVAAGRIEQAASLLRPLSGPARDLVGGWLADVDARLAANTLEQRVGALMRAGMG